MLFVTNAEELDAASTSLKSVFRSGEVYVEKEIIRLKYIEFPIQRDINGNVIHL